MSNIVLLPASDLWMFWEHLRPHFATAAETTEGKVGVDDLLRDAVNNVFQVWAVWDGITAEAVLITRILDYPKLRTLSLQYCAGRGMQYWFCDMERELRKYAEANKCASVEIVGRQGWQRVLKSAKQKAIHLEISLEAGTDRHIQTLGQHTS